ncbi:MAG: SDR family oxidoreductase [Desulfovibrio sp.]|uniref:SDR family oxidoreductase n=1 Tax=Desulfovibrio sp. 7SRBS1 TaxID=3378064 RepID=UPI003B40B565
MNTFSLEGKTAVVTGSRRGIGQGLALGLARAGANIVSIDRNDPDRTRAEVQALGRTHTWKKLDLLGATKDELQGCIDEIAAETGLDILVNNAGICPRHPITEHPSEYWEDTIKLNLSVVWYLSQAAVRHMVAQGHGKIVITGSALTFQGGLTVPGYAASKHGVAGLAKAFSNELASKGVNVNVIAPGYIATDLTEAIQDDTERNRSILERIPAGRWGTPADLAGACVFLASSAADYVNGAVLNVDGGWLGR